MVPQPKGDTGRAKKNGWLGPPIGLFFCLLVMATLACYFNPWRPHTAGKTMLAMTPSLAPVTQLSNLPELVVATHRGPQGYWTEPDGRTLGFEHDMALQLGVFLGKPVRFLVFDNGEQVAEAMRLGKAHLAVLPLGHDERLCYTPSWYRSRLQLVYSVMHVAALRDLSELGYQDLAMVPNPEFAAQVLSLQQAVPSLRWHWAAPGVSELALLRQVYEGEVKYAVGVSEVVRVAQNYYPDLAVAMNLGADMPLGWAFRQVDSPLYQAALRFLDAFQKSGGLARHIERYYGSLGPLAREDAREFLQKRITRLPKLSDVFRSAGRLSGMDWRLLAAISFQESRWDNDAISPTGVRGLMMLTADTADRLGVSDRLDANQAVPAAARYLANIRDELPLPIEEPDRTWIALAAYNIGQAHVQDAQGLARQRGLDGGNWNSLRQTLPLLADPQVYGHLRHGFARGGEPVRFVEKVRSYYDVISHFDPIGVSGARYQPMVLAPPK